MKLDVKIKNGIYDLTASGMVILDSSVQTVITIKDEGQPFDMIIQFKNDESNPKETKRETKLIPGKNAFEINFTNYNSVLGSFTKEFWFIGTSNQRKLYFTYLISSLTDSKLKRLEYSFYLGEEVKNG